MRGIALGAVDPDAARQVARDILADRRFHPRQAPRPFAGFFRRVGELVVDPVLRFFRAIGDRLPAVGSVPWLLLAAMVIAAAAVITIRLSAGRARRSAERRHPAGSGGGGLDPDELERLAAEAERGGDLEAALRLRFRAGLGRLAATGVVRLRPGLTNAAVSRTLRSPGFDTLAGDFDEVAYGGRSATESDVIRARTTWPTVIEAAHPLAGTRR
ncbi:MAG TPA: DUF4129 domain-containing protein [Acidimicrobiia bacterium]|nr:DUF4129 domain-containing protein [Acidimicrobiia bacterium]